MENFLKKHCFRTFLFLAAFLFCTLQNGRADDASGWPDGWQKKNGTWKIENGTIASTNGGFASFASTRNDLDDFDLHLTFTRRKEYASDNHVGFAIERKNGRWRFFFSGNKVMWFFVPQPPTEKEKYGIFKGEKPFVSPLGAKVDFELRCRQQNITLIANGTRLAQFGPAPGDGSILVYTYRVACEFAKLNLTPGIEDARPSDANAPATMNLVANPSFEICTNPDLPDGWTHEPGWGNEPDERWFAAGGYERWHRYWSVETRRPFHGRRCMRIQAPLELHAMVFRMAKGKSYALSVYLKSDRDNFGAFVGVQSPGKVKQGELVRVHKTWKRYFVKFDPFSLPAHPYQSICIIPTEKWGKLWADAVQLEEGLEPSSFTPFSPLDTPSIDAARETAAGPERDFLPEARIPRPFAGEVRLDGLLNEKMWPALDEHELVSTNGSATRQQTRVKFAATPRGILVGITATIPGKQPLGDKRKRDSGALFGDDSVELFMDPVGEGREYYQFVINAYGAKFDQKCVTGRGVDRSWDGKWRSAARLGNGRWTAEIYVPFSDLFPGDAFPDGSTLRINVCRTVQPTRELQNWSPTYGVFHAPNRFGFLFLGNVSEQHKATAKKEEKKSQGLQAFFEFSYYTNEDAAALFLKPLSGQDPIAAKVEVRSHQGKLMFAKPVSVKNNRLSRLDVPIRNWPTGTYNASITRSNGPGKPAVKTLILKKLKPGRVRNVKTDHLRRTINVDGKPFFPFGPLWTRWARAEALFFVHEAGFNTIWAGDKWTAHKDERRYLGLLDTLGLNLVETRYLHYWAESAPEQQRAFMNNTRDSRCVIARMYIDEPGRDPEKALSLMSLADELNPYVPFYVNYNSWGLFQRFAGLPGPIMSIDRYPIGSGPPDEIYTVEKVVEFMEKEAAPRRMPVWIILQSMGHKRTPTPRELNFMTYISIIRGARGIAYWAGIPRAKATWQRMKELSGEVKALAPILFSTDLPPEVKIRPDPTVTVITRQVQGTTYVIALNRSRRPCRAEFFLAGPQKPLTCRVQFESRKLPVKANRFSDTFEGFQRHAYELKE